MVLYHATTEENAAAILREGFRNGRGISLKGFERGVWFSDAPSPYGDGTTLCVDVPDRIAASRELINDEPLDYREFLLPAKLVNRYPITLMSEAA